MPSNLKPLVLITCLLLLGIQFGQSVYASGSGSNNSSTTNGSENNQEQTTMTVIPWSESNRLKGTGSPYLEQHTENPVHWVPWGEEAFE